MNKATKPTGRAATLAQIKAYLSSSDIEGQFNLQTGSILNWYELDDNKEPITQDLVINIGRTIKHTALTSIGDELVAEYDCIEYALISTGLRLCNQDEAPVFIETYAKAYDNRKQDKPEPSSEESAIDALCSLAIYSEELRTALASARQILEYNDPYFHQTTLGSQIALLTLNRPSVLDGNLIDSVNRESVIKGSELYAVAKALADNASSKELVADLIAAVGRLNGDFAV
ncbi:hypothetical protein NTE19_003405 [Vibrio fluvialis]|nr:hypothetical protein [Vibrio fluvialis]